MSNFLLGRTNSNVIFHEYTHFETFIQVFFPPFIVLSKPKKDIIRQTLIPICVSVSAARQVMLPMCDVAHVKSLDMEFNDD